MTATTPAEGAVVPAAASPAAPSSPRRRAKGEPYSRSDRTL